MPKKELTASSRYSTSSPPGRGASMSPSKSLSVVPISVRPYQGRAKTARPSPAGTMQAAEPVESVSRSSSTWVPRLGLMRGMSSSLEDLLGADAVGEDAGRVDDVVGLDLEGLAGLGLTSGDADRAAVADEDVGDLGAVQHHRPEALRLAEHREHQPHVVGLAVEEEVGAVGLARRQRGHHLEELLALDRPVAVRRPVEVLVLLLGGAHLAAAATDPGRRHHVVHVEADAEFAVEPLLGEGGDEERRRVDQVRRQLHHQLALQQRLADQPEVEVLQVAQAAVDHLRGAAGRALRIVPALEQSDRVAARGGVEGDAGAGDAAADHDDLEVPPGDLLDGGGAREHQSR